MAKDHVHAKWLGRLLATIDRIPVETEWIQINRVFFNFDCEKKIPGDFLNKLKQIVKNPDNHGLFRFVTHCGIMENDVRAAVQAGWEIMEGQNDEIKSGDV